MFALFVYDAMMLYTELGKVQIYRYNFNFGIIRHFVINPDDLILYCMLLKSAIRLGT